MSGGRSACGLICPEWTIIDTDFNDTSATSLLVSILSVHVMSQCKGQRVGQALLG